MKKLLSVLIFLLLISPVYAIETTSLVISTVTINPVVQPSSPSSGGGFYIQESITGVQYDLKNIEIKEMNKKWVNIDFFLKNMGSAKNVETIIRYKVSGSDGAIVAQTTDQIMLSETKISKTIHLTNVLKNGEKYLIEIRAIYNKDYSINAIAEKDFVYDESKATKDFLEWMLDIVLNVVKQFEILMTQLLSVFKIQI